MKLTPLDIRHKEFKRGMSGYADVEVDEFLDEVADEYERLFKENIDLNERVESIAGEDRPVQAHRGDAPEDAHLGAGERRGAQAERHQGGAAHPARRRAQGAPDGQRGVHREAGHRADRWPSSRAAEQDFGFKFRQLLEGYLKQIDASKPDAAPPVAEESEFDRRAEAIKAAIARDGRGAIGRTRASRHSRGGGRRARARGASPSPASRPPRSRPAIRTTTSIRWSRRPRPRTTARSASASPSARTTTCSRTSTAG